MENWSIGKRKSGCEGFQEPSLNNNALTIERAVLSSFHHSITPLLHKPLKFQQSKSPLGITKAWSYGPGFLLNNVIGRLSFSMGIVNLANIRSGNTVDRSGMLIPC